MESLFTHHFFNSALQSCKDAMGESSSLQDRSVLHVSESNIARRCAFSLAQKSYRIHPRHDAPLLSSGIDFR